MSRPGFDNEEQVLDYMKRIAVARSGFSSFLALEPVRCWNGEAEIVMKVRPEMTQHHGFAHGAIIGLMADNACAWAASSAVGDVVTGSYTINFLAPAKGTTLRSKGSVVKSGKRQVVVRADVWSEDDKAEPVLVAVAQATIVPTGIATSKETVEVTS
ncbi:PaaI family thioesterase [Altererythrobacter lutimaris]|uniref:PaaI family thioesterase n=1 Tax=Altererythrobacter lutimaris TaxID=2743979 RepID=A0A850HID5_9SPHN|nr:PaaI family thioesterase [Altererythrobacter lutimaris]NVE95292.1 PaaI family thioesterase [Altererythrobacter lutimaris]